MSSAIIRNGHWRRRDPLAGLSPTMLHALAAVAAADLNRRDSAGRFITSSTLRALAERGLLRRRAGPDGLLPDFGLTREGEAVAAEIDRRAAARARLIAERPSRAQSPGA